LFSTHLIIDFKKLYILISSRIPQLFKAVIALHTDNKRGTSLINNNNNTTYKNQNTFPFPMVALFVISVLLAWCCLFPVELTECSTHWRVTESGRIESHDDSPFTLLRPYDLVVFMKQADRAKRLEQLKKIITSKEKTISIKKDPSI
jgi:hypothetical protein